MKLVEDRDLSDFGCSKGCGLKWAAKLYGVEKDLSIDIDSSRVSLAVDSCFDACWFGVFAIPDILLVDL